MAGAYCKFCDQRCFVDRVMPPDSRWMPGRTVHLATCAKGAEYDRQESGYDFTTAINPYDHAGEGRGLPLTPNSGGPR